MTPEQHLEVARLHLLREYERFDNDLVIAESERRSTEDRIEKLRSSLRDVQAEIDEIFRAKMLLNASETGAAMPVIVRGNPDDPGTWRLPAGLLIIPEEVTLDESKVFSVTADVVGAPEDGALEEAE